MNLQDTGSDTNSNQDQASLTIEELRKEVMLKNSEADNNILDNFNIPVADKLLTSSLIIQFKYFFKEFVARTTQGWITELCQASSEINDAILERICTVFSNKFNTYFSNNTDLDIFYDTIGNLYHIRGRYMDAESYYKKSLEIKKNSLNSPSNLHITCSTSYLARNYLAWNKFDLAKIKYKELLNSMKSSKDSSKDYNLKYARLNNILGNICFRLGFYSESQILYSKAEKLSGKYVSLHCDNTEYIKSLIGKGKTKFALNKQSHKNSLKILDKALKTCKKETECHHSSLKSEIYDLKATISVSLIKVDEANKYFGKSWDIRHACSQEDNLEKAKSYFIQGNVRKIQKSLSEALSSHMKSLEIRLRLKTTKDFDIAESYLEIGNVYKLQKKYQEAMDYYTQSKDLIKTLIKDENCISSFNLHSSIGYLYEIQNELDLSLKHYERSLKIGEKFFKNNPEILAMVHEKIANIHKMHNNYAEAKSHIIYALNIHSDKSSKKCSYEIERLQSDILKLEGHVEDENRIFQNQRTVLQEEDPQNHSSSANSINPTDQNNQNSDDLQLQTNYLSTGNLISLNFLQNIKYETTIRRALLLYLTFV